MSEINISTEGFNDIVDITEKVGEIVNKSDVKEGVIILFVIGSTATITTVEYEPGLVQDIKNTLEKIAPMKGTYQHEEAWHDGNGYAHVRAALMKPLLVIPFKDSRLLLGTWQQIVLIDFDNKPRDRKIIAKIVKSI